MDSGNERRGEGCSALGTLAAVALSGLLSVCFLLPLLRIAPDQQVYMYLLQRNPSDQQVYLSPKGTSGLSRFFFCFGFVCNRFLGNVSMLYPWPQGQHVAGSLNDSQ